VGVYFFSIDSGTVKLVFLCTLLKSCAIITLPYR